MFKSYKYRLYPTDAQKILLAKHFGAVRFVYNLALETKKLSHSGTKTNVSRYDLQKQLVELKNDCPWLKEINSQSLQHSLLCLDNAFGEFYKGKKDYPVFKRKQGRQAFTCPQGVKLTNKLTLPKFQEGIKAKISRNLEGDIKSATVSITTTGKYYASIVCDCVSTINASSGNGNTSVGVDFGIKTFLTLSDGSTFDNNRYLKTSIERLKVLQRRASRKKKGSANRKKANMRVALLHERINNQRTDYLQKISTSITKKYDTICIEDLNIEGMVKNHNLAQSISDTGWNEFENMLKYKCEWSGKTLIHIPRFYPSSKTCSNCGSIRDMPLSERMYNCVCGLSIDRDLNAAINIKYSGLGKPVVPVELPTLVGAVKQEGKSTMPKDKGDMTYTK